MHLIIVTDIFGRTAALNELAAQFARRYNEIIVVSPYAGQQISFLNQEAAYQYFQQHCGLEKLTEQLKSAVESSKDSVDIVGFSIGATAAWELSATDTSKKIRRAVCFYGSRIREKTDLCPKVPTTLVFPQHEEGFDLEPVVQAVENKPHVEIIRTGYRHGFMNKKSTNFSATGYLIFSEWLAEKATG